MAEWYVWQSGSGTGTSWATAYATLTAAMAAKAAGDTFYVAHDYVETGAAAAAITITSPGTEVTPCRVYCVNRAGSVPPVSADLRTTATITTTTTGALTLAGTFAEIYGIIFTCGSGATGATLTVGNPSGRTCRLVNCALRLAGTGTANRINAATSGSGASALLENTTMQFGAVGQAINPSSSGRFVWKNTPSAITGATIPTTLILSTGVIFLEGVDLSALTAGKSVFSLSGSTASIAVMKDCKLGASVTIMAGPPSSYGAQEVSAIRCDSGDTNYRTEKYTFAGTQTTETSIVRTGGATDGTTPIAWKIVTTANSRWEMPFECLPISIWNETVGSSVTVTIQGIWGSGSVPRNDDIWIDCEYLGTSGFPLASKATSTKADGLIADAALSAGTGTWGGSTTKFAMSATFTPQEKGPITIYVRAALLSTTFYVDPKPVIT